jgi:hypothetical protein
MKHERLNAWYAVQGSKTAAAVRSNMVRCLHPRWSHRGHSRALHGLLMKYVLFNNPAQGSAPAEQLSRSICCLAACCKHCQPTYPPGPLLRASSRRSIAETAILRARAGRCSL